MRICTLLKWQYSKGQLNLIFLEKINVISVLEKVTRYAEALNEIYVDVSVRPRREIHLFNIETFKA